MSCDVWLSCGLLTVFRTSKSVFLHGPRSHAVTWSNCWRSCGEHGPRTQFLWKCLVCACHVSRCTAHQTWPIRCRCGEVWCLFGLNRHGDVACSLSMPRTSLFEISGHGGRTIASSDCLVRICCFKSGIDELMMFLIESRHSCIVRIHAGNLKFCVALSLAVVRRLCLCTSLSWGFMRAPVAIVIMLVCSI